MRGCAPHNQHPLLALKIWSGRERNTVQTHIGIRHPLARGSWFASLLRGGHLTRYEGVSANVGRASRVGRNLGRRFSLICAAALSSCASGPRTPPVHPSAHHVTLPLALLIRQAKYFSIGRGRTCNWPKKYVEGQRRHAVRGLAGFTRSALVQESSPKQTVRRPVLAFGAWCARWGGSPTHLRLPPPTHTAHRQARRFHCHLLYVIPGTTSYALLCKTMRQSTIIFSIIPPLTYLSQTRAFK